MVEYRLPKPGVVGSSPIARSISSSFLNHDRHMKTWLLIVDTSPVRGSLNMAVDEFLFRHGRRGRERSSASIDGSGPRLLSAMAGCRNGRRPRLLPARTGSMSSGASPAGKSSCTTGKSPIPFAHPIPGRSRPPCRDSYKLISLALVKGLALMGLAARLAPTNPLLFMPREDAVLFLSGQGRNRDRAARRSSAAPRRGPGRLPPARLDPPRERRGAPECRLRSDGKTRPRSG